MSDDLVNRLLRPWDTERSIMSQTAAWMTERQQAAERISSLDGKLATANARIRELEAELAALREARGVRVKPLVWDDWSARHRTNYTAETPFGRYGVMQFHFPDMHFKIEPPSGKPFIAASLDAAKAAAQSDYERRILSALEPAPVTPAEAARVLLEEWRHGEGPLGDLVCYSMDEDGVMRPDIDGRWTEFSKIEAALLRASLADAGEEKDSQSNQGGVE